MSKFHSVIVAIALIASTSFYSPKADAAVSLFMKDRTMRVLAGFSAGLSAASGVIAATGGGTLAIAGISLATFAPVVGTIGLVAFGAIGLVLLDDQTVLEMNYAAIDIAKLEDYQGLSAYEVSVYNSELEELNAIKKTIVSDLGQEFTADQVSELWELYKPFLSVETVKVAEVKALEVIKSVK